MARTKVRNYPSKEEYENHIKEYMLSHKGEIIAYMLRQLGYDDIDSLREDEYSKNPFWVCGSFILRPKNKDMAHEWFLDNGRIPDYIYDITYYIYPTQSVIIKEPIMEKDVKDMELENDFYVTQRLD